MAAPDLTPTLTDSQKININVITLNTAVNELQTDVRELNRVVLLGNGEIPLREQTRNNTLFIKDVKYWIRIVGGALILQTVAFVAGIAVALIRFLPILERLASQP